MLTHLFYSKINCASKPSVCKIVVKFSFGKWSHFTLSWRFTSGLQSLFYTGRYTNKFYQLFTLLFKTKDQMKITQWYLPEEHTGNVTANSAIISKRDWVMNVCGFIVCSKGGADVTSGTKGNLWGVFCGQRAFSIYLKIPEIPVGL